MLKKFEETFSLFHDHFGLFAAIILTVQLPANLFIYVFSHYLDNGSHTDVIGLIRLTEVIMAIFEPIYIGALIYALYQIKSGKIVTYQEAMAVGFSKWGALLAARLVAGIFIGLGIIALIIPGIILAVRYSLLDFTVILEDRSIAESRARSTELTMGRRWQLFETATLFLVPSIIISVLISLSLGSLGIIDFMPIKIAWNCILDIYLAAITIILFLFYWESINPSSEVNPTAGKYEVSTTIQM